MLYRKSAKKSGLVGNDFANTFDFLQVPTKTFG